MTGKPLPRGWTHDSPNLWTWGDAWTVQRVDLRGEKMWRVYGHGKERALATSLRAALKLGDVLIAEEVHA